MVFGIWPLVICLQAPGSRLKLAPTHINKNRSVVPVRRRQETEPIMKTDIIDRDQQLPTNSHLPATDRIKTGSGSDNSQSETDDNSFYGSKVEEIQTVNGTKI